MCCVDITREVDIMTDNTNTEYKYDAFISYSHKDIRAAQRIHKILKTYRVPHSLVKQKGLPKRLGEVCLDTENFPAGGLSDILKEKLKQSRFLIVVCSTRTPKSKWVPEEIRFFSEELGRRDKILPVIIEGTYKTSFPEVLRNRDKLLTEGNSTPISKKEDIPLAANIGKSVSWKRFSIINSEKLRLIAPIIGCEYSELRQREKEWLVRKFAFLATITIAVLTVFIINTYMKNKEIEAANAELIIKTKEAVAARDIALRNQSLFLADLSQQQTHSEDRMLGMLLALEALPKDMRRPDKPYVAEAEYALYMSINNKEYQGRAVLHHKDFFKKAIFSPDAKKVATILNDETVAIWDAEAGKQLLLLDKLKGDINSVAYSPNGKKLVTASHDGAAIIWNAESGEQLAVLKHEDKDYYSNRVNSAEYSPDGKKIVTTSDDGTAIIWDAETGNQLALLDKHTEEVENAVFSPDGKKIATASRDGRAIIWNAESGKQEMILGKHMYGVDCVTFSPDGRKIVTISNEVPIADIFDRGKFQFDAKVIIWDAETGKQVALLDKHKNTVNSITFSPDGRNLVTASDDGAAIIWDAASGKQLALLQHSDVVNSAEYSPDGKKIITASKDNTAKIWDAETGEKLAVLDKHTSYVTSAIFSPDGKKIITTSVDETAIIWDVEEEGHSVLLPRKDDLTVFYGAPSDVDRRKTVTGWGIIYDVMTGKQLATLDKHTDYIREAHFSPDGRTLVTTSDDETAIIWDAETGRQRVILNAYSIYDMEFSPDGKRIITTSRDGKVIIWDTESGRELAKLGKNTDGRFQVYFSPDGNKLVTLYEDEEEIGIWDTWTGKEMFVLHPTDSIDTATFSPDSEKIVIIQKDGISKIWDIETGKQVAVLEEPTDSVDNVVFSPDSKKIVISSGDGTAKIWNAGTGKQMAVLDKHTDSIHSMKFSPDGKKIVTASDDRTAIIWDAESGNQLAILDKHKSIVASAMFSPDGKKIVTASWDGTAIIWDAETGKTLALLDEYVGMLFRAEFTSDNKKIATLSYNGATVIWPVYTTQELIVSDQYYGA